MTFDQLMREGWKAEPPQESFAEWKRRCEEEITRVIIASPRIRAKLIASAEANEPRSSPASRPATPAVRLGFGDCPICGQHRKLTRHHLIPRAVRHLVAVCRGGERICRPCHDGVHLEFTNEQLIHEPWENVVRRVRVRLALV